MNEKVDRLASMLAKLDEILEANDYDGLIDVQNKIELYIDRFFKGNERYFDIWSEIDFQPRSLSELKTCVSAAKSLINTLIEDIELSSKDNTDVDEEKSRQLRKFQKEIEEERLKVQHEARLIRELKEELYKERDRLYSEREKFDEFTSKLEIADKNIDFQFESSLNKKQALYWAAAAGCLLVVLLILLIDAAASNNTFLELSSIIRKTIGHDHKAFETMIKPTVYFTFFKLVVTKLFLYSLLVFAIIFCVKNYNALMHNHIINSHKSNALKSTLSLLNTARSEDGNDKLLLQATQAIFSHQTTGYNGRDSEPNTPNLVTNLIETVTTKT